MNTTPTDEEIINAMEKHSTRGPRIKAIRALFAAPLAQFKGGPSNEEIHELWKDGEYMSIPYTGDAFRALFATHHAAALAAKDAEITQHRQDVQNLRVVVDVLKSDCKDLARERDEAMEWRKEAEKELLDRGKAGYDLADKYLSLEAEATALHQQLDQLNQEAKRWLTSLEKGLSVSWEYTLDSVKVIEAMSRTTSAPT